MKTNINFSNRIGFSLFKEQRDYLFSPSGNSYRLRLLATLVSLVADHDTEIKQDRFHLTLHKGQAMASEIELAKIIGCNRKTIHIMLGEFEKMGMTSSMQVANRTTVHSLFFISGWKDDGRVNLNDIFDRDREQLLARLNRYGLEEVSSADILPSADSGSVIVSSDFSKRKTPTFNSPTEVEETKVGVMCHGEEDSTNVESSSDCPIECHEASPSVGTSISTDTSQRIMS